MTIKFSPTYIITPQTMQNLMRIEAAKQKVLHLPMTPMVLATLRETARLFTTHYSTMIEGNRLSPDQISDVIKYNNHFPGRERDEGEVKAYYIAMQHVERWVATGEALTQNLIQKLHALVMADGRIKVKQTPYRDGQNVIRESKTGSIIYMPPEAKDVPSLMRFMINWITEAQNIPCPIVAAIAHYQFATIHPYYDGNGRTARLLTTFILHKGGYDLKGLYSLEEYYAKNLNTYYEAISIGPSHNYYFGRAEADITPWIDYFVEGMMVAFENVIDHMIAAQNRGEQDQNPLLRQLDPKQRKVLELFKQHDIVTASEIGELLRFKPKTASTLCQKWVASGFLVIENPSNKARSYRLSNKFNIF